MTLNPIHGNKHADREAGVRWRRREEVYYAPTWHIGGGAGGRRREETVDLPRHTLGCHLLTKKKRRGKKLARMMKLTGLW